MLSLGLYKEKNLVPVLKKINVEARDGFSLVKVDLAGICRTDVYVAEGKIYHKDVVLGHEFSGWVVDGEHKGQYVCCNPIFPDNNMLGMDYDGCFAEYVLVPDYSVYPVDGLDRRLCAYIEPIAASLAPLKANIKKDQKGAVYGKHRIGLLTHKIFEKAGYNVDNIGFDCDKFDYYDYVIETGALENDFNLISRLLVKNGKLIIKSRNPNSIPFNFYDYVKKEISIECCYYHDFNFAINFAKENQDLFLPLMGDIYKLKDWEKAFEEDKKGNKKIFLEP